MKIDRIFPAVLVVVMIAAGLVCLCCRRWCDAAYYLCGAGLNLAVILKG